MRGAIARRGYRHRGSPGRIAGGVPRCGDPAMVILDLNLPGMSGMVLLMTLRSERNERPILVLTALGSTAAPIAGLRVGAGERRPPSREPPGWRPASDRLRDGDRPAQAAHRARHRRARRWARSVHPHVRATNDLSPALALGDDQFAKLHGRARRGFGALRRQPRA